MSKKIIYTIGYTLFQNERGINVDALFKTLQEYNVQFLVDVRSVPFSKQYPQCNADNMKMACKNFGITYMNMPEIGAKADSQQEVFSKASDILLQRAIDQRKPNWQARTRLWTSTNSDTMNTSQAA